MEPTSCFRLSFLKYNMVEALRIKRDESDLEAIKPTSISLVLSLENHMILYLIFSISFLDFLLSDTCHNIISSDQQS
jgi:hypothetical protein